MPDLKPIILYTMDRGPVPWRVTVIIEALELPHEKRFPTFEERNSEPYKSLNPNSKIPSIEDPNTGMRLWEAGAIILYLLDTYDKEGRLHSLSGPEKYQELAWMWFNVSEQWMYVSQRGWFLFKHVERVQSVLDRYEETIKRTIRVIDDHLKKTGKSYLTGNKVTAADLVFVVHNEMIPQTVPQYDPSVEYPYFAKWNALLVAEHAFQKAAAARAALGFPLGKIDQRQIDAYVERKD